MAVNVLTVLGVTKGTKLCPILPKLPYGTNQKSLAYANTFCHTNSAREREYCVQLRQKKKKKV